MIVLIPEDPEERGTLAKGFGSPSKRDPTKREWRGSGYTEGASSSRSVAPVEKNFYILSGASVSLMNKMGKVLSMVCPTHTTEKPQSSSSSCYEVTELPSWASSIWIKSHKAIGDSEGLLPTDEELT
ncbi:hypothetical protein B296_00022967 [Ensete ventricosum]|uniref:Uncharacterized protein n=1 Tax=Ensete ventricosum TaxID=4639 RepID=A0A427ANI2_ENSVE|nr:hypothetical protein B296_00022967 [Ensete ventricosum]